MCSGTSSRLFRFVMRMLATGANCLPAAGIGAISEQLASRLPVGAVRLGELFRFHPHVVLSSPLECSVFDLVVFAKQPASGHWNLAIRRSCALLQVSSAADLRSVCCTKLAC